MGEVSVFMIENYLRQPVDDDGPLSLVVVATGHFLMHGNFCSVV